MKKYMWSLLVLSILLISLVLLLAAGCGGGVAANPPEAEEPPEPEEEPRPAVVGAITLEDGRKVDGFAYGGIGDEMRSVFFSFQVDKAELMEEFEGKKADPRLAYLVAEVTVKNVMDKPVTMWADDFIAQWGDGNNDYGYPIERFYISQMEEEYSLAPDESVSCVLVYEVSLPEAENEYGISYLEYYADDVEGKLFMVNFKLSANVSDGALG
jgi:hypothetical protein